MVYVMVKLLPFHLNKQTNKYGLKFIRTWEGTQTLLVIFFVPRGFSLGTPVFLSFKNQCFI